MNLKEVVYILLLVLCASFLLFWHLGDRSLVNWDEGIYAITEHEFINDPSVVPQLFGDVWIEKVPLGYWLNSIGMRSFGITEFGIRFVGSCIMLFSALLLYLIGKRISTPFGGWLAAMLYSSSPLLYYGSHFVREGDLEPYYVFFLLLSVYWYIKSWDKPWYILATAAAVGLGFMTRGFSFILVGVAILIDVLIAQRKYTWQQFVGALGVGLCIIMPWHVAAYILYPDQFIAVYWNEQFASRIVDPLHNHAGSVWFYLSYIWSISKVITITAIGVLTWLGWNVVVTKNKYARFLAILLVVLLMPIHMMATKLHWYLVPIMPIVYIAFGFLITQFVSTMTQGVQRVIRTGLIVLVVVSCVISGSVVVRPHMPTSVELVFDVLQDIELSNVVVYDTELWQQGKVMPAAYMYWHIMAQKDLFPITQANLDHYLARTNDYRLFVTHASKADVIIDRFPDSSWQVLEAGSYVVLVR